MSFFDQLNKIFEEENRRRNNGEGDGGSQFPFGGRGGRGDGDGKDNSGKSGDSHSTGGKSPRGPLIPTLIVVALLIGGFIIFTGFYTDFLWFSQTGYSEVFLNTHLWQLGTFVAGFGLMFIFASAALRWAYRSRPVYAANATRQDSLSAYASQFTRHKKAIFWIVPIVLALFIAFMVSSQWPRIALFVNREEFGQKDPEFGLDISFYTNILPFLSVVVSVLFIIAIACLLIFLLVNYIFGGLRFNPQERKFKIDKSARIQLGFAMAFVLLIFAARFCLERFATVQSQHGGWAGALYTDVNAVIPTQAILAIAAVVVAVFFIIGAVVGNWKFPVIGTVVLIVMSLLGNTVYPWVVQQLQVQPSELSTQSEYIKRNIKMTRQAYGIENLKANEYNAEVDPKAGALGNDKQTIDNIRLLDPNIVSSAFKQIEGYRPYYGFPRQLKVDRYDIDGKTQDAVVAVRDLDVNRIPQQSWVNQYTVYTHGYGMVAAAGNKTSADGKPDFLEAGIPAEGKLGKSKKYEPRVYFGESSPEYSIVGAPAGSKAQELDRPNDSEEGETYTTFSGNGGPSLGNWFNRLNYAVKYQSTDLLLSDRVNDKSQILYDRDPKERVKKVAPYLTVDNNAYPAVVDGRIKWIIDGYTTSSHYPYSTAQRLESSTEDSVTARGSSDVLQGQVNYMRNSVKATVDAYDGSVDLYAWEENDPILKAWQKVYPSNLKSLNDMSADVMSHVRYPEDMFKVQRDVLTRYHVTNVNDFYANNDAWSIPDDPTVSRDDSNQVVQNVNQIGQDAQASSSSVQGAASNAANPGPPQTNIAQPPYYLSLQMPGEKKASFSLTSTFIPQQSDAENNRNVLYGYLSVNSDAGHQKGRKADTYGKFTLLELPRSKTIPGPGRVQNDFNSDPSVSQELNLLRQGESEVLNGNLLTLPAGHGFLYVQPVYVQSSSGDSKNPSLQRVLVSYGEKIGFARTLDEALDQLFDGDSGVTGGQGNSSGSSGTNTNNSNSAGSSEKSEALTKALSDANKAMKDSQKAMADGDWAEYGKAQKRLEDALKKAVEEEKK